VGDPEDEAEFGLAVRRLLEDHPYAEHLGANARERAIREFLGDRHLSQYAALFAKLDNAR
jgi:glycosyltransferase involved in cell wall biosynthesis